MKKWFKSIRHRFVDVFRSTALILSASARSNVLCSNSLYFAGQYINSHFAGMGTSTILHFFYLIALDMLFFFFSFKLGVS